MNLRNAMWSVLLTMTISAGAQAGDLSLKDGSHWVALASSKDLNQAIGIARLYSSQNVRVVASQNGWYGVVLGPVHAASLEAFRKAYQGWPELPADALFSRGDKYTGTLWHPPAAPPVIEFSAATPAEASDDGLTVTASLNKSDNGQIVHIEGRAGSTALFGFDTPEDFYADFGTTLQLVPLDPASPMPEALFAQSTGGAHCCAATWIVSEARPGAWQLTAAGLLDGSGFWLEDIDGDGSFELMSVDNAFLYAFDSYVASFAPIRVENLRSGKVGEAAHDTAWTGRVAQDLGAMEFNAKLNPAIWKSNGYLAAWVATKIELGQGDEAWAKMLKNYDRASNFGPQTCITGQDIDNCPADKMRTVPFPKALAEFLKTNGYVPVPQ